MWHNAFHAVYLPSKTDTEPTKIGHILENNSDEINELNMSYKSSFKKCQLSFIFIYPILSKIITLTLKKTQYNYIEISTHTVSLLKHTPLWFKGQVNWCSKTIFENLINLLKILYHKHNMSSGGALYFICIPRSGSTTQEINHIEKKIGVKLDNPLCLTV